MRPHRTESGVFNTGRRKCRGLLLVGARADRAPLRSPCVRPSPLRPEARQGRSCAQGALSDQGDSRQRPRGEFHRGVSLSRAVMSGSVTTRWTNWASASFMILWRSSMDVRTPPPPYSDRIR